MNCAGTPNGLAVALLEAIAVVSLHEQTCMGASQKMTKYQACDRKQNDTVLCIIVGTHLGVIEVMHGVK